MKVGVVKEFRGEHAFLSNFYVNEFTWRGIVFPTGEHAFSYAKGFHAVNRKEAGQHFVDVLRADTPGQAKGFGRRLEINVPAWDGYKVQVMREIVHARFQTSQEDMVGPLINTGAMLLVEGNDWGDTFWGRCNGKGFNTLGVILMEERGYWLRGQS
jgi:ribA/ribD-fused uncharacterized protein